MSKRISESGNKLGNNGAPAQASDPPASVVLPVNETATAPSVHATAPPASVEIIDTCEMSRRLSVCEATIKNYRRRGLLPYVVLGRTVRFRWSSVVQALERMERCGQQ